jgi:diguanylate cyclase (GGDEF)-like protein
MNNAVFWIARREIQITSSIILGGMQLLIVNGLFIGGLFALILHTRARQVQHEAQQYALDLLLVQKQFEVEQELKIQAELQAQTDYLTGLFNRRRFVELAKHELTRSSRFQRPFTLLMIDIDHFKTINDTWGHSIGDIVLQQVAHLIRDTLRDEDIFGRTGGEEFAAVIVETDGNGALEVAQRLCAIVADAVFTPPGTERIRVSISVGLSQLNGRNVDFDSLLNEADWAMYKAKEAGRNQAVVSE